MKLGCESVCPRTLLGRGDVFVQVFDLAEGTPYLSAPTAGWRSAHKQRPFPVPRPGEYCWSQAFHWSSGTAAQSELSNRCWCAWSGLRSANLSDFPQNPDGR